MISLFQTTNRGLVALLSFLFKVENAPFRGFTGGMFESQNIGTLNLIKGTGIIEETYFNFDSAIAKSDKIKRNIRFSSLESPIETFAKYILKKMDGFFTSF